MQPSSMQYDRERVFARETSSREGTAVVGDAGQ